MDEVETKIPASEKDSSMMKRSSFEMKSLNEKEKKDKDKKKAPIIFEFENAKQEKLKDIFEKADDTEPESFQELLGIADKKESSEDSDDEETDSTEALEADLPVDQLDQIDKTAVAEQHVTDKKAELAGKQTETEAGSPEAAGDAGELKFINKFQEKLPEMPVEEAAEEAAAEVIDEIKQSSESEDEEATSEESDTLNLSEDSEIVDADEDEEEGEDSATTTPPVPPAPPAPPTSPNGPNTSNVNPGPPSPPNGPNTPPPPNGPIPPWANPNIVQPFNTPNVIPTVVNSAERAHSRAGDMLVGGILGYIWGRHRGRVKAEHRLEPIQDKLKQEVTALQEKITAKELEVRELAKSVAEEKKTVQQRQEFIEHLKPKKPEMSTDVPATTEPVSEQAEEARPYIAERNHAEQLHKRPETIGRMAVTLDVPRETIQDTPREAMQAKRVETMAATELLAIAERIVIEGSSVREMYDAGRLDPEGLRNVVAEYLRGGSVEKVLSRETLAEERRHERAPERQPNQFGSGQQSSGAHAASPPPLVDSQDIRQKLEQFSNPENLTSFPYKNKEFNQKQPSSPKALIIIVSLAATAMVMAAYFITAG